MLVLTRKPYKGQDTIEIDGPCRIILKRSRSGQARIAIDAAPGVSIRRGELPARDTSTNEAGK